MILRELFGWLIPALVGRARKLVTVTDADLRAIARGVVGDGGGSWGHMFAEARKRCADLGAELTDELDVRVGDALQEAMAALALPDAVAGLGDRASRVMEEWEAAERRGRSRGEETARGLSAEEGKGDGDE